MVMTSRERVQAVLNHKIPDQVPVIIGVSNATGIKMAPYKAIKKLVGIDAPDEYIYDWPELGSARVDEATLKRLHGDVRGIHDRLPEAITRRNKTRPAHSNLLAESFGYLFDFNGWHNLLSPRNFERA